MFLRKLAFWLDGKCSADYGIVLQDEVKFDGAEPNYSFQEIPGRSGDLVIWDARYKNVTGTATCYVMGVRTADAYRQRAVEFFLSNPGYLRLETEAEPDVYRMVIPTFGPGTDVRMQAIAPFSVTFKAKPQVYLKSGEDAVQVAESGAVITNPTGFSSLPLITVYGNAPGSLYVGGVQCKILSLSESVTLDCDTQNAYKDTPENPQNSNVAIAEYPVLSAGETEIRWDGGIQSVEIIPRWCRIT